MTQWVQLASAILGAAGGSALIVTGLARWLGTRIERRFETAEKAALEAHRNELQRLLETHKSDLAAALETHREMVKAIVSIDVDLRQKRIDAYRSLWQSTSLLPAFRRPTLSYRDFEGFSDALTRWYYEKGGIYLPHTTMQQRFLPLQQAIVGAVEAHRDAPDREVTDADYGLVRDQCSALRSALAGDVQGRRESPQYAT